MSVMYTPGPRRSDDRGSRDHGGTSYGSTYTSHEDGTKSIRALCGLFSIAAIALFTFLAFQVISLVLAEMGTIGVGIGVAISATSLVTSTVLVFKRLEERKVAVVLVFLALYGLSFLVPGLPAVLALLAIAVSLASTIYLIAAAVVQSRWVAVAITLIPVLGGMYCVRASLSSAGLVTQFTTGSAESTVGSQLRQLRADLQTLMPKGAVVSYQIRNNRLYADICANGTVQSMELDTSALTKTGVPWLQKDLSRQLDALLGMGEASLSDPGYSKVAAILSTALEKLRGFESVLIADGALVNFPHQTLLHSQRVLRSVSLNGEQIKSNLLQWLEPSPLRPDQIAIVNALPCSSDDLQRLDISGESWESWRGLQAKFAEAEPKRLREGQAMCSATRLAALDALQNKECVLIVVAHCDGYSIRLPNGESIEVKDLTALKEKIRLNRPRVFLFSCETAHVTDTQSFAKALLDCGAQAVIAPVAKLSASEALDVFKSFLNYAFGDSPLPVGRAFEKALEETNRRMMEIWVGQRQEPARSTFAA